MKGTVCSHSNVLAFINWTKLFAMSCVERHSFVLFPFWQHAQISHGREKNSVEVEHSLTLFVQQHTLRPHNSESTIVKLRCIWFLTVSCCAVTAEQYRLLHSATITLHWYAHFSCLKWCRSLVSYYFVHCVYSAFLIRWILLTRPAPSHTTACQTWADTKLLHKCCFSQVCQIPLKSIKSHFILKKNDLLIFSH